jgi:glycosyltransferase involved in cell wall biosynthesis
MTMTKSTDVKKIFWLTPDYFMCADASIVPELTRHFEIEWLLLNTKDSRRNADGILLKDVVPAEYQLKYRQKDPRVVFEYFKIINRIRKSKCDLVYLSFHGLPYFFPLFFLFINPRKVIYGAHNVSTPKGASHEKLMKLYHAYVYWKLKNFHVFSKNQLEHISGVLPTKKHYYAPFVLEDYGPSNVVAETGKIKFLFFGYIREYKRLDLLLSSFQALYEAGQHNIELVIAGNCENWEQYEAMIRIKKAIKTRIEIIPNKEVPDIVSSCHYMVLPYQDIAQSAVLTLAYRYRKPVIISDIPQFREYVVDERTGYFFEAGSAESLKNTLRKAVAKHEMKYDTMQHNIDEFMNNEFSINRIVNKYNHFLNDCLKNSQ